MSLARTHRSPAPPEPGVDRREAAPLLLALPLAGAEHEARRDEDE